MKNKMEIIKNNKLITYYLDQHGFTEVLDKSLINEMKLFKFKPGEYIARSNETPEYLFFYVEGKSKVFQSLENGKSLLCRFFKPPAIVGDVEIFSGKNNICNLQTLTDVICVGIHFETIRKAAESSNKLLIHLCSSLGKKLASFNMNSAINQNYPLENRLASYLATVSESKATGVSMISDMHTDNLTELAGLLGVSYRHLTRTIKKFKEDEIIIKNGKDFIIKDKQKLQELAKDIYI